MNRRTFNTTAAAATAAALLGDSPLAQAARSTPPPSTPMEIVMLLYPGMTALDLIGPQYAFACVMGARVTLVAKSLDPVTTDTNVTFVPQATFATAPRDLTVLFVPGGSEGTLKAMQDAATLEFLRDRASRARWVTSVCTGSLVLGAAGLLQGRKATSHWLVREKVLPLLGAVPVDQRVVIDGNRVTGAGVSAGIDFGLTLVSKLKDVDYARAVQLMAEYDPQPPFVSGSPAKAGPTILGMMNDMHAGYVKHAAEVARQAGIPAAKS